MGKFRGARHVAAERRPEPHQLVRISDLAWSANEPAIRRCDVSRRVRFTQSCRRTGFRERTYAGHVACSCCGGVRAKFGRRSTAGAEYRGRVPAELKPVASACDGRKSCRVSPFTIPSTALLGLGMLRAYRETPFLTREADLHWSCGAAGCVLDG